MLKAPTSTLFDAFADDLLGERSARPLIIVGASKVDSLLFEILNLYLLPKLAKTSEHDELLEGDRPLGTFSARIKMCRRLGLIDATLYLALEKLRALRNLCAHSIAFDVSKSPAREHLADMRKQIAHRQSFRLTKDRYFDGSPFKPAEELHCFLLTLCVLLEAIRGRITTTHGNKRALRIATK